MPIILWQVWGFFAPAFEKHTQRMVVGFAIFSAVLLAAGVAVRVLRRLEPAVHFLTSYDSTQFDIQIRAKELLLVRDCSSSSPCAIVFELPIFILALTRIGILPVEQAAPQPAHRLRDRRRRGRRAPGCRPGDDDARDDPADDPLRALDLDGRLLRPAAGSAAPPSATRSGSASTSRRSASATASKPTRSSAGGVKPTAHSRREIRELALSFPETYEDSPWGHPVFKVGDNRMFAAMSNDDEPIAADRQADARRSARSPSCSRSSASRGTWAATAGSRPRSPTRSRSTPRSSGCARATG